MTMPYSGRIREKRYIINIFKSLAHSILALGVLLTAANALAVSKSQIDDQASAVKSLEAQATAARNQLASLKNNLKALDQKILEARKNAREDRTSERLAYHDALREFKRQTFELERIERDISLIDSDLEIIQRDRERDQQRFEELNIIKRRLEENAFQQRQQDYQDKANRLEQQKAPLTQELQAAQQELAALRTQLNSQKTALDDSTLDQSPRVDALIDQRKAVEQSIQRATTNVANLNARLKRETTIFDKMVAQYRSNQSTTPQASNVTTTAPETGSHGAYVFVISGTQVPNIEDTLQLKNWVESYGAKYIQANWNGFDGVTSAASNEAFKEAFRSYIRQIPKQAKLILIGHGLGGGTAIEAATEVAEADNRVVDFLAVLDPMGEAGLRANIVYETQGSCFKPDPDNTTANAEYLSCLRAAEKRNITSNVKYFYNRWQKDAQGPADYQRKIPTIDNSGEIAEVPTASGRFSISNTTETQSDQRRVFFSGDNRAHRLLLANEAKNLPNLLVDQLR